MDRRKFFCNVVGAAGMASMSSAFGSNLRPASLQAAGDTPTLLTGFKDLDRMIGGLRRGSITAIAGRPAMGKSTLALNIATSLALDRGVPVAYLSAPKGYCEVMADVAMWRLRLNRDAVRFSFQDLGSPRAALAYDGLLQIDDRVFLSAGDIRTSIEDRTRKVGICPGLVVVDRPEMLCVGTDESTDHDRMTEAMRVLKAIARDFDAAVAVTTDVGRGVEGRRDKRPRITDLRYEATPIAMFADLVMLLYRDEIYAPDSLDKGMASVEVARNRHGTRGSILLTYRPELARFGDFDWSGIPATEAGPA